MNKITQIGIKAAKFGGKILNEYFYQRHFLTHSKADTSFQTIADIESEKVIINIIMDAFPEHGIVSEEHGEISSVSHYKWLIDPLDGTENFIMGIPYFSISLTLLEDNNPIIAIIYNPITNQLYVAEKGNGVTLNGVSIKVSNNNQLKTARLFIIPNFDTKQKHRTRNLWEAIYKRSRRVLDTWSPALDWSLVASGKADGLIVITEEQTIRGFGDLILEEANGLVTDFKGNTIKENNSGPIVATNGTNLHNEIIDLVKNYYTEFLL